jgi:hypothetical protein
MDMRNLITADLGQSLNVSVDDKRGQDKSLSVNATDRLEDIFRLCCDSGAQIHSLIGTVKALSADIMILREEIRELKDTTRRTEAIIGSQIHTEDGVNAVSHSRDAKNTRRVSSDVVAAVIRSIWHTSMGNEVCLPVDMAYLSKLCDTCFVKMAGDAKSDLGIMLMDQIAAIDSDAAAGSNIIRVLTTTGSTLTATMLRHMLDCIQLLGTTYAFMIPYALSSLLNRVQNFNGNTTVLKPTVDERTMICPHSGYNVKGSLVKESRHMKAFIATVKLGNKIADAKRLCKCITDNLVHSDGTMSTPSTNVVSKFSMGTNASPQQRDHDTSVQSYLDLDSIMTPVKRTK